MSDGRVTVIDLWVPTTDCSVCGEGTVSKWGIPVFEDRILRNEEDGPWGGAPACERCWAIHKIGDIDRLYEIRKAVRDDDGGTGTAGGWSSNARGQD